MRPELPAPILDELDGSACTANFDRLIIVRDDLLPGGTKRRALSGLYELWPEDEFVFGGPAQGFAQVAMGWATADTGKRSTYFVAKRKQLHPYTAETARLGARIVQVPVGRLNVVQARARQYAAEVGARFLPLGFDVPEMLEATAAVARALPIPEPEEVWCVAGAGLLTKALQAAWPNARHHAVQIGFSPSVGAARLWRAPETFAEPALDPPPFPSTPNYDAKAWRFLREHASTGALFWNVAGNQA